MSEDYYPRIADTMLKERLARAGAVLIRGAKWCGKTRTAEEHVASALYMQDPDELQNNLMIANTKPSLLLQGPKPRLIDEWQDTPQLWDAVRFAVDRSGERGQFVLTGSATPGKRPMHSGVGRFSFLDMRPMSLFESRESTGEVSLSALLAEPGDIEGHNTADVETVSFQVCRGGWPQAVVTGGDISLGLAHDYVAAVAEEDISKVDDVARNPTDARLVMRAYARCVATMADMASIRGGIRDRRDEMARSTFSSYVAALRRLYVFEDLEAWSPSLRARSRVQTTPTRHFVDPSLAAAAMGATPQILLRDLPTLGLLFESMCVRDLRVYMGAYGGDVFHYRDNTGLEADAVVVARDGRWGAFEVKLGAHYADEAAANLLKLANKVDQDVMGAPAFLAVLVPGGYAVRRSDGVYVIPISCLGV